MTPPNCDALKASLPAVSWKHERASFPMFGSRLQLGGFWRAESACPADRIELITGWNISLTLWTSKFRPIFSSARRMLGL